MTGSVLHGALLLTVRRSATGQRAGNGDSSLVRVAICCATGAGSFAAPVGNWRFLLPLALICGNSPKMSKSVLVVRPLVE